VPRVAIDVPAALLRQPSFVDSLRGILDRHGVDPDLIELEVPERCLGVDAESTLQRLHELKDVGVRLAVADFAGRLPLDELQRLPLDVLKIGAGLVARVAASKDAQAVCAAILAIAHGFALDAVADGVASQQHEAFLMRHNCLYGQGDYYGAAMEAERIGALLAESGGQATRRRRITRKRIGIKTG
jgi:EAL domain-containing protein (putative c-di-GMP-specific phosphodiesterase class I)